MKLRFINESSGVTRIKLTVFLVGIWEKSVRPESLVVDASSSRPFEASEFWISEKTNEYVFYLSKGKKVRLFPVLMRIFFDEKVCKTLIS